MGVYAKGERYLCEICGNEVVVEKSRRWNSCLLWTGNDSGRREINCL